MDSKTNTNIHIAYRAPFNHALYIGDQFIGNFATAQQARAHAASISNQ